ncbi:hypothetical protein GGR20_000739 [Devosia subaequoris]|uniref:Uncharacterized protein n=1 Tax=Devosia subaequoris TaxID=395930 RepID=A0A7W6IK55_9HYPH|nr:hypothetical protein [Devosia subaequoris]
MPDPVAAESGFFMFFSRMHGSLGLVLANSPTPQKWDCGKIASFVCIVCITDVQNDHLLITTGVI